MSSLPVKKTLLLNLVFFCFLIFFFNYSWLKFGNNELKTYMWRYHRTMSTEFPAWPLITLCCWDSFFSNWPERKQVQVGVLLDHSLFSRVMPLNICEDGHGCLVSCGSFISNIGMFCYFVLNMKCLFYMQFGSMHAL